MTPRVKFQKANVLRSLGRLDEADRLFEKAPDGYAVREVQAEKLLRQGKPGEAIRLLEPVLERGIPAGDSRRAVLGCAYAAAGRREDAENLAASASLNPVISARIFVCLGDKDRAFVALDRAVAAGPFRMGRALNGDGLSMLRGDPRLLALRRKVGLPE